VKSKIILKSLCFILIFCSLYGSTPWYKPSYIGISQYHMNCYPSNRWRISTVGSEHKKGFSKSGTPVCFHFTGKMGSWNDFLTDSNTYEDCLLEDGYQYLQYWGYCSRGSCSCSTYTYSNISPLLWNKSPFLNCSNIPSLLWIIKKDIPYIEGAWFNPEGCHWGFFRLYMFPTKEEKSTYYLYIELEAYQNNAKHEELFNEVFNFVAPRF
jgi:hypothetical protein